MKKIIRTITVLLLALMALTGCSKEKGRAPAEDKGSYSVAIVVGANSNSYVVNCRSAAVRDAVYNTAWTYGNISVIQADGSPKAVINVKIPEPTVSGLSKDKLNTIANDYTDQIIQSLSSVKSETPEADYYQALSLGAQALRSSDSEHKILFVLGNMCGTTGNFDCTRDLLNADSEKLINEMSRKKAIIDLTGIDVVVSGLGSVAEPQPKLSALECHNLEEIYTRFFEAGNAKSICFNEELSSNDIYTGLPDVSVFETSKDRIEYTTISSRKFDENSSVKFVGDSDEYVNKTEVMNELSGLATDLKEGGNEVFIIGITAGGGNDDKSLKLSKDRAEAVKNTLVELGVSEDQMKTLGLASNNRFYVNDRDSDGNLIESIASGNRAVLVIDAMSEDATGLY